LQYRDIASAFWTEVKLVTNPVPKLLAIS
jgi:hypothetical protein